jgi:hypothetical protein
VQPQIYPEGGMIRLLSVAMLAVATVALAGTAHAARIPYKWGNASIVQVADLPNDGPFKLNGQEYDLGWHQNAYSIAFLPFWASDGDGYVLYNENGQSVSWKALTPELVAEIGKMTNRSYPAQYPVSFVSRTWGWIVLASLIAFGVIRQRMQQA